jgi:hypothetical protein
MSVKDRAPTKSSYASQDDLVASDPALRASGVQARAERSSPSQPPLSAAGEPGVLLSIGSPAEPALLEPTYAFISAYSGVCLPPQVAQRLNVAAYELYSNALRYGSSAGEVRLELRSQEGGVRLTVKNHAEPQQLERVRGQVARIQEDPDAAFSGEMNRFSSASQPPPMIGLVRVAHECGLKIELTIDGDCVEVSTVCVG